MESDMIPAVEHAIEAGQKVFVYFPPFKYSSNLSTMTIGKPIHMEKYESRFKKCVFPDVVHLKIANFDLRIPEKWKQYQS